MLEKNALRQLLQKRRENIPAAQRQQKSRRIHRKLFSEPCVRNAVHVAIYYGIRSEVATRSFLTELLKTKKVYLPKVDRKSRTISFHRVRHLIRDLRKSFYSIREPKAGCPRRSVEQMDVVIVPGVGFDRACGRLGRGGGYYDRALRRAFKVPKIGLCFREQLVKKVPVTKHDVRMDKIITD